MLICTPLWCIRGCGYHSYNSDWFLNFITLAEEAITVAVLAVT